MVLVHHPAFLFYQHGFDNSQSSSNSWCPACSPTMSATMTLPLLFLRMFSNPAKFKYAFRSFSQLISRTVNPRFRFSRHRGFSVCFLFPLLITKLLVSFYPVSSWTCIFCKSENHRIHFAACFSNHRYSGPRLIQMRFSS